MCRTSQSTTAGVSDDETASALLASCAGETHVAHHASPVGDFGGPFTATISNRVGGYYDPRPAATSDQIRLSKAGETERISTEAGYGPTSS